MHLCLFKNHLGTPYSIPIQVSTPKFGSLTGGLGEDIADFVDFILLEVTGSAVSVNLSDLADQDGKSSADTLDDTERETDLLLAVDVGVHHTEEVLELVSTREDESGRLNEHISLVRDLKYFPCRSLKVPRSSSRSE
jgi:hypothetical protein